jgi:hypothetical protein
MLTNGRCLKHTGTDCRYFLPKQKKFGILSTARTKGTAVHEMRILSGARSKDKAEVCFSKVGFMVLN